MEKRTVIFLILLMLLVPFLSACEYFVDFPKSDESILRTESPGFLDIKKPFFDLGAEKFCEINQNVFKVGEYQLGILKKLSCFVDAFLEKIPCNADDRWAIMLSLSEKGFSCDGFEHSKLCSASLVYYRPESDIIQNIYSIDVAIDEQGCPVRNRVSRDL
jgi:hypothetical protein